MPALAEQPAKSQPTSVSPVPQASPGNVTQQAGNVTQLSGKNPHNVTSGGHVPPGQLKLGKLNAPPAISTFIPTVTWQPSKKAPSDDSKLVLAKKIAGTRIGLVVSQLELYKKQIARSSLPADEKSAIIALADRNIAWYRQQDSDIQAAGNMDAVTALVTGADQQSTLLKVNMKKEAGIMACDELDARIATARSVSAIAAGRISDLKAGGNSTATIVSKLADYNAHVDTASKYAAAARAAFTGITGEADTDSSFDEGYRQIRQADQEMGKAYADLKEVYLLYFRSTR